MTTHAPCLLKGPVTIDRPWWMERKRSVRRQVPTDRIRTALVNRVRKEIAAGTYDSPEKWDKALDNLFDRLTSN